MISVRRADERGHHNFGWLDTYHTFSFGDYYDPDNMGFRVLRVINEDRVRGGAGFGEHPHRDMEIITYVMEGSLRHSDNFGHSEVIRKNDFQKMSAGTGIIHSEYNGSDTEPVHLYQIWILPGHKGVKPNYNQIHIKKKDIENNLRLVASGTGEKDDAPIHIHQDTKVFIAGLGKNHSVSYALGQERYAWVQVTRGNVNLFNKELYEGDGAAVMKEQELNLTTDDSGEFLLFDMP